MSIPLPTELATQDLTQFTRMAFSGIPRADPLHTIFLLMLHISLTFYKTRYPNMFPLTPQLKVRETVTFSDF